MKLERLLWDLEYIFLNCFVNKIPSWVIRRNIYEMFGMRIGDSAKIGIGTVIYCPNKITVGDRVIINENCYLDGRFGIEVNHDVGISSYAKIITGTHIVDSEVFKYSGEKIIIRHHAWIASGATVLYGSRIAENAVVGAGSVYKGICESGDIIVGNPGKVIRKRKTKMNYRLAYDCYFR